MASSHHALFQQLENLTLAELQSSHRLIELLREKVNLLVPTEFSHNRAGEIATVFIDLVKDSLEDRYQALSIRAFAHICVALDYFVDPDDAILDPMPGGLMDDLVFLEKTSKRFQKEIEAYQRWRQRQ